MFTSKKKKTHEKKQGGGLWPEVQFRDKSQWEEWMGECRDPAH